MPLSEADITGSVLVLASALRDFLEMPRSKASLAQVKKRGDNDQIVVESGLALATGVLVDLNRIASALEEIYKIEHERLEIDKRRMEHGGR